MGILRVILALSVLLGHTTPIFGLTLFNPEMAVQLFFTISGFYMALVLHGKYTGARGMLLFYLNRFLRLYPVYLVVLLAGWVLFFAVWWRLGRVPQNNWMVPCGTMSLMERLPFILSNWTMIGLDWQCLCYVRPGTGISWMDGLLPLPRADGAVWGGQFRTIEQAWSVGAEICFYAIAPLLMRLKWPLLVLVAGASMFLRWRIDSQVALYGFFFWLSQVYFFIFGMLLFRWYRSASFKLWPPKLLLAWCLMCMVTVVWLGPEKTVGTRWLLYPSFMVVLPSIFHWSKTLSWDRALGELSYPIYISHMLVVAVFGMAFRMKEAAVIVPAVCFLAWLLWRLVDLPVDRFRQSLATRLATLS